MITFHLTEKVRRRLKKPMDQYSQDHSSSLGNWYVNLLFVRRKHMLLIVSEKTLLPVIMPAKFLSEFPNRFPDALSDVLIGIGIGHEKIQKELSTLTDWRLCKTVDRRILGSMNDFSKLLRAYYDDVTPLSKLALRMGITPCSPIGMKCPINATADVFGEKISFNPFDLLK
ncbi:MAG: hypothetical protein NTV34_09845 [Proteobacteria bacterium]|nr:hypothetical protein [Pseudomonadota bacterium]